MRDMTLEELGDHDIDNLQHVLSKSKKVYFTQREEFFEFIPAAMKRCLLKMGVTVTESTLPEEADKQLKEKNVRIERRPYAGDDAWRAGIYIYKDNEIAGFVSTSVVKNDFGAYEVLTTM